MFKITETEQVELILNLIAKHSNCVVKQNKTSCMCKMNTKLSIKLEQNLKKI